MQTITEAHEVKARKKHTCDWCYSRIVPKEKYMKSTHVGDGDIWDWKAHMHCNKLIGTMDMYKHADIYEGLNGNDFQEIVIGKCLEILTDTMSDSERDRFKDLIYQLNYVEFNKQLWHVIRYYNGLEKGNTPTLVDLKTNSNPIALGVEEMKKLEPKK